MPAVPPEIEADRPAGEAVVDGATEVRVGGPFWLDRLLQAEDRERSILAFLRLARDPADFVVVLCNFTPVPRPEYRVGVPEAGSYAELLNSDDVDYWSSSMGNPSPVETEVVPWHGQPWSIRVMLPPLAVLILQPVHFEPEASTGVLAKLITAGTGRDEMTTEDNQGETE
jgi:Alpha amylase, C-terminal all-beta domain